MEIFINDNGLKNTLFRDESQKVRADIFLASDWIIGYSYPLLSDRGGACDFVREDSRLPACIPMRRR